MAGTLPYQIVALSGAGSTWKLLEPQKRAFGDGLVAPEWIQPWGMDEPIGSYAQRWAEHIRPGLDPSKPLFLCGSSFGGLIAQEMAKALRPAALLLISTCRSSDAVTRRCRIGARVEGAVPQTLIPLWLNTAGRLLLRGEPMGGRERRLALESTLEGSIRARSLAERFLANWPAGSALDGAAVPTYQIHGSRDPLFSPEKVGADEFVANGKHLITLSHGVQVNRFLKDSIRRHAG